MYTSPMATDDLSAKLAQYHKAIEEEYTAITLASESGEADVVAEAARKLLINRTAEAARTIAWLAENATSESTRLAASKYILDNALGEKGLARPVDPLESLVNELKGNTKKKAEAREQVKAETVKPGEAQPKPNKPLEEGTP